MVVDPDTKYIVFRGEVVTLRRRFNVNGTTPIWIDEHGTIYGFPEEHYSTDHVVRLGVGPLSLPESNKFTAAAVFHDGAYSIPVYQLYNLRTTADEQLELQSKIIDPSVRGQLVGRWLRIAAGLFGWLPWLWENKKTRNM